MFGQRCKYCEDFMCVSKDECRYSNLLECLKLHTNSLIREVGYLQKRKSQLHNETSLKWRNKCFYYKDRSKKLEKICKVVGVDYTRLLEVQDGRKEIGVKEDTSEKR